MACLRFPREASDLFFRKALPHVRSPQSYGIGSLDQLDQGRADPVEGTRIRKQLQQIARRQQQAAYLRMSKPVISSTSLSSPDAWLP